jgi:hypothetical protein
LKLRQLFALDQLSSKFLSVLWGCLGRNEVLQLARCDYARVSEMLHEGFEGAESSHVLYKRQSWVEGLMSHMLGSPEEVGDLDAARSDAKLLRTALRAGLQVGVQEIATDSDRLIKAAEQ